MSNDETKDYGAADTAGAFIKHLGSVSHEQLADITDDRVIEVLRIVNDINERTGRIEQKVDTLTRNLDGLSRMIARSPSGLTLVNMVEQILNRVEKL